MFVSFHPVFMELSGDRCSYSSTGAGDPFVSPGARLKQQRLRAGRASERCGWRPGVEGLVVDDVGTLW